MIIYTSIIFILYSVLLIYNIYKFILLLKKRGWGLVTYSLIYLNIFYVVLPLIYLVTDDAKIVYKKVVLYKDLINVEVLLYTYLCIVVGFIAFYFGISLSNRQYKQTRVVIHNKLNKNKISELFFLLLSLIVPICFVLYIKGFGGLNNAIANANLVRSGYYKSIEEGSTAHTFFFRFIFLCLIPILYFFYIKKRKLIHYLVLIINVIILIILYLFLSSGRQVILDLLLMYVFYGLIKTNKTFSIKLIYFAFSAILILPILEFFFSTKSNSEVVHSEVDSSVFQTILNEFGFPYYSLNYSAINDYNFYYFSDFISGLFGRVLPSSFTPGWEQTNKLNTFLTTGDIAGYVPPGLFAQGYYSLGILGIFIICLLTSLYFSKVDSFFKSIIKTDKRFTIFYVYFIVQSLAWVRTALPANYFYNFTFMIFWLFIFMSFKFKKQKSF